MTGPTKVLPRPAKPGPDYIVLAASVATLCVVGLIMVLSASSVASLSNFGTPWWYFEHQLEYLCLGVVAFLVAQGVRMRAWQLVARPAILLTGAALLAVLVVGRSAGGASRWLGSGSFQFQPGELAKLAVVLFAADVLARREGKRDWVYRAGPALLAVGACALLIMLQPDMGTAVVLCCAGAAVLFAAGFPLRAMLGLGLVSGAAGFVLASSASYRAARLTAFLNPFAHASTTGYQSVQGLVALGVGHWTGTGVGQSLASWGYLPNQYTDFIFAVIGQETGFAGSIVILGIFACLCVTGMRVAWRASTTFDCLVAAGVTAWLGSQAVINIGAVAGVVPVTGVPLPFVSYGGSSLVIVLFAAGLLANVARSGDTGTGARGTGTARARSHDQVGLKGQHRQPAISR
jgi:cell division protein FtsW